MLPSESKVFADIEPDGERVLSIVPANLNMLHTPSPLYTHIRYFEISGGYMIPKSCLLNFLLSPHILDSYRPSKKLVDLAKEFSRQGKSTKKPTAK